MSAGEPKTLQAQTGETKVPNRQVRIIAFLATLAMVAPGSSRAASPDAVVTDQASGGSITRAMVTRMIAADARAAPLFRVPMPGPDAAERLAAALQAHFSGTDATMRSWLLHADENLPHALPFLANATPQTRERFIERFRLKVLAAPGEGERLLNLTEVLVGLGSRGGASRPGSAGSVLPQIYGSQLRVQRYLFQGPH